MLSMTSWKDFAQGSYSRSTRMTLALRLWKYVSGGWGGGGGGVYLGVEGYQLLPEGRGGDVGEGLVGAHCCVAHFLCDGALALPFCFYEGEPGVGFEGVVDDLVGVHCGGIA